MKAPDISQQVAFLRRVPLLEGFDDRLLELLVGFMKLERMPAKTILCKQGGPGDACYFVGHGVVEVVVGEGLEEHVVAELGPWHVCGEVALIDGKKRSATLRCKTDVSLFTLKREDFDQLWRSGNKASMRLLDNIARDLVQRLRQVNTSYSDIFSKPGQTMTKLQEQLSHLRSAVEADDREVAGIENSEKDLLAMVGYRAPGT